jgi:hypothetical protein
VASCNPSVLCKASAVLRVRSSVNNRLHRFADEYHCPQRVALAGGIVATSFFSVRRRQCRERFEIFDVLHQHDDIGVRRLQIRIKEERTLRASW